MAKSEKEDGQKIGNTQSGTLRKKSLSPRGMETSALGREEQKKSLMGGSLWMSRLFTQSSGAFVGSRALRSIRGPGPCARMPNHCQADMYQEVPDLSVKKACVGWSAIDL